jgi:TonB family protein
MLQVLVESRAARPRRASWTAASVLAHSLVIALAVWVTTQVAPDARRSDLVPDLIYVATQPAPQPAASPEPVGTSGAIPIPSPVITIPNISMPTIPAPQTDVGRLIDELTRTTVGSFIGTNPGVPVAPGGVHTAETVDRVVAPLRGNPSPAYPARLSSAGVEGDVTVSFVVDTTGRVEPASVEILQASHALFGDAVRQWLRQTRYGPALANGRPVRQLVRQRVGFTITR